MQGPGSPRDTCSPGTTQRPCRQTPCKVSAVALHLRLTDRGARLVWGLSVCPAILPEAHPSPASHSPKHSPHSPPTHHSARVLSFHGYAGNFHGRLNTDWIINSLLFFPTGGASRALGLRPQLPVYRWAPYRPCCFTTREPVSVILHSLLLFSLHPTQLSRCPSDLPPEGPVVPRKCISQSSLEQGLKAVNLLVLWCEWSRTRLQCRT